MSDGYTKGPWESDALLDGGLPYGVMPRVSGADGSLICVVGNMRDNQDIWDANARLIAAAPDLLDVLAACEAWEADVILNADWSSETPRLTQAQWDELVRVQGLRNAAIAKARGADFAPRSDNVGQNDA